MNKTVTLTDRFDRALLYASHVHGGQVRKGNATPFIAHLMAVAATVLEYGGDEDLAIAALLHDCVEDQGGEARLADIRNRFGERVAKVVVACSDSLANTSAGEPKLDWQVRKDGQLARLRKANEDLIRVALADKVHNARTVLRDLRTPGIGAKIWSRFSVPKERTLWYYRSLADTLNHAIHRKHAARLGNLKQLAKELDDIVCLLEAS